jgi:hypothetical protein
VLGAQTPPAAIAIAVLRARPDLVALSLTVSPAPRRGSQLVAAYGAACGDTPWLVGGAGVARYATAVHTAGGVVVGPDFDLDIFIDDLRL